MTQGTYGCQNENKQSSHNISVSVETGTVRKGSMMAKVTAIAPQTSTAPESSRRLRFPDYKTFAT